MSDFARNRNALKRAMYTTGFLKKRETTTQKITESKNNAPTELRIVELINLPCPHWVIELELENAPPFSMDFKKVEQAIVCFVDDYLLVFLIEMKTVLKTNNISKTQRKFESSIRHLLLLLNLYQWDELASPTRIQFYGIICCNELKVDRNRLDGLRRTHPDSFEAPIYDALVAEDAFPSIELVPYRDYVEDVKVFCHVNATETPTAMTLDMTPILQHAANRPSYTVQPCPETT